MAGGRYRYYVKQVLLLLLVLGSSITRSQTVSVSGADTADIRIQNATAFLIKYFNSFANHQEPDYRRYWGKADLKRSALPDDMVYAIACEYPTYRFGGSKPSVFFARPYDNYVQLKTLFATTDTGGGMVPWAITNHYVMIDPITGRPYFVSELELHQKEYKTVRNRNITYHFPATTVFDLQVSNRMLDQLKVIEDQWGFKPIDLNYYYAPTAEALARMRGMDYNYAMDNTNPSGISYPEHKKLFCQGLGEGYLHEVLHMYFNPRFGTSPMCHAMIYYLAGSLGKDFNWYITRMNSYLQQHPETDLSQYETLLASDRMLHMDYVVKGLLCRMLDEKDGLAGLKRALQYSTVDELLFREFNIHYDRLDAFLREGFRKYDSYR